MLVVRTVMMITMTIVKMIMSVMIFMWMAISATMPIVMHHQ